MELKMVEVSRSKTTTYGVDFPTMFSLTALTNWLGNQVTTTDKHPRSALFRRR